MINDPQVGDIFFNNRRDEFVKVIGFDTTHEDILHVDGNGKTLKEFPNAKVKVVKLAPLTQEELQKYGLI